MKRRLGTLTVLLSTLIALFVVPATAQETSSCMVDPNTPYLTIGGPVSLPVIEGTGSVSGCDPDGIVMVCLDHFAITWNNSCSIYGIGADGSGGGPSAQAPCLPGIWQTSVTAMVPGPDPETLHSDSLIVTSECPGEFVT